MLQTNGLSGGARILRPKDDETEMLLMLRHRKIFTLPETVKSMTPEPDAQ